MSGRSARALRVLTGGWHASAGCCDGLPCLTARYSGCGPVKKLVFLTDPGRSGVIWIVLIRCRAVGIGHENDQVPKELVHKEFRRIKSISAGYLTS